MSAQTFYQSYVATALWSSLDGSPPSGGEPMDRNYTPDDISAETLRRMRDDCDAFYLLNGELWQGDKSTAPPGEEDERAGSDFWLTRNGHGAGFWDGDYPQTGDVLTDLARNCGEFDLYVGDDGQIWGSPE